MLVVGTTLREMGGAGHSAYNRFSLAFAQAAEASGAEVRARGFEASWVELPESSFNAFLEALVAEQMRHASSRSRRAAAQQPQSGA